MRYLFLSIFITTLSFSAKCKYEACSSESFTGQMQVNMNTYEANKEVINKLKELKNALENEKNISDINIDKHKVYLAEQKMKQLNINEILFLVEKKNQLIYSENK